HGAGGAEERCVVAEDAAVIADQPVATGGGGEGRRGQHRARHRVAVRDVVAHGGGLGIGGVGVVVHGAEPREGGGVPDTGRVDGGGVGAPVEGRPAKAQDRVGAVGRHDGGGDEVAGIDQGHDIVSVVVAGGVQAPQGGRAPAVPVGVGAGVGGLDNVGGERDLVGAVLGRGGGDVGPGLVHRRRSVVGRRDVAGTVADGAGRRSTELDGPGGSGEGDERQGGNGPSDAVADRPVHRTSEIGV